MTKSNLETIKNRDGGESIRRARAEDSEAIHHVLSATFRNMQGRGYSHHALEVAILSRQEIEQRILRGDHILVADIDGCIQGTATGIEEHETLHVCSVAVHPELWGQGVGRNLMLALERVARDRGCHKLWLQTAWSMSEAISLYEGLGYKQEGYQPCQFYGEDFLLFGKVISDVEESAMVTSALNGAIFIYPGVEELDFIGVYEVLVKVASISEGSELALEKPPKVSLLAREQRITCANELVVQPHKRYMGFSDFDFVVIPGGRGVEVLQKDRDLLSDLMNVQADGKLISSVCTGALILAWAGILNGRRATTHHLHRDKLAQYCQVVTERVVPDGNVITSAGVSASLDLGLYLVEKFYNNAIARQVASRIEYPMFYTQAPISAP